MAALGWLLNLGFAGGVVVVTPDETITFISEIDQQVDFDSAIVQTRTFKAAIRQTKIFDSDTL